MNLSGQHPFYHWLWLEDVLHVEKSGCNAGAGHHSWPFRPTLQMLLPCLIVLCAPSGNSPGPLWPTHITLLASTLTWFAWCPREKGSWGYHGWPFGPDLYSHWLWLDMVGMGKNEALLPHRGTSFGCAHHIMHALFVSQTYQWCYNFVFYCSLHSTAIND